MRRWRKAVDAEIQDVKDRLKALECPHKNVKFVLSTLYSDSYWRDKGWKKCKDCGKVLEYYDTYGDFLAAKLQYCKEEVSRIESEMKREAGK